MIKIEERNSCKLSGVESLFLSFAPTPEIIRTIKSSEIYNYEPKTKEWEVPITSLSYLLDNLTYFDDISILLNNSVNNTTEKEKPILDYKLPLFEHQLEAIRYGLNNPRFLLLDAPGLGKTATLVHLAEELKVQKGIEHCLIICGINTLKTNWEKEIEKHSDLTSVVIGKKISKKGNISYTSVKERAEQLYNKLEDFFVIINVEMLREDVVINSILKSQNNFGMMVVDEVHKMGYSSTQGDNLLKLQAPYMVAATGTLLTNSPLSAYLPLAWIGVERKKNVTNFKRTYCIFDGMTRGRIIGFRNIELLKDEIDRNSLRRTKDLLNLPPKNIINEFVEMDEVNKKFYDSVKAGVKEECDKVELKPNNVLSLVTRLRQATSCPNILTSSNIISNKVERAVDIAQEVLSNGDKVVIFSNFKEPVKQLKELLKEYHPLIGTGDMKDEEVSKNIDKFQKDDKYKVFIGTIAKMGTGITLTKASYLIFIDCTWTASQNQQAEDRIYRIGTKSSVFIYYLWAKGTIDESIKAIVERKGALSDFVIDDKLDDRALSILRNYLTDL